MRIDITISNDSWEIEKNMNRECTILSKEEMKNHQLNLGHIIDNLKTIKENIRWMIEVMFSIKIMRTLKWKYTALK